MDGTFKIMKEKIAKLTYIWKTIKNMPHIRINLMLEACEGNHPFYERITKEYFQIANARHPKLSLIKQREYGVSVFQYNDQPDCYIKAVESSARRNYKKAIRNGYMFRRINFNEHIEDVWDIRRSAKVRQGEMAESFLNSKPSEVEVPKSSSDTHDYPYFGIFNADNKLVAYASGIVAGELMEVEHIYGHSDFQSDGVVPMLYISVAGYVMENFPMVKYYCYGTFFGASPSLQRFKKKFKFLPHRVSWVLESKK